ncbi:DUF6093 family protein [Actinotignum urinale]|uniref:DUF6093 family protein n=1 Tax=Actinotignum urinale TaxID=190146 RepID=UPI000479D0A3|nr:DUF6093 family protein [Actinotignum urinale]MDY5159566.1 DUF6093 family protein [Actinotignum urinale]
MVTTCKVVRADDYTGEETLVYEGKCRVRSTTPASAIMADSGASTALHLSTLHVPYNVSFLERGDTVLVEGKTFTIRGQSSGTQQTSMRYQIEDVE